MVINTTINTTPKPFITTNRSQICEVEPPKRQQQKNTWDRENSLIFFPGKSETCSWWSYITISPLNMQKNWVGFACFVSNVNILFMASLHPPPCQDRDLHRYVPQLEPMKLYFPLRFGAVCLDINGYFNGYLTVTIHVELWNSTYYCWVGLTWRWSILTTDSYLTSFSQRNLW